MTTPPFGFERYLNVYSALGPSFSSDGQQLSFLTNITGVAEVWRIDLTSESAPPDAPPPWPAQLTFLGDRVLGASYSPTAPRLLIGGDRGGDERTQLSLLSADGSALIPLTDEPGAIFQFGGWQEDGSASNGWSPDGARIVYASNQRDARYFDIYERALDGDTPNGGAPRLLLQHDGTNYALGYSPDGRSALVQRQDSNTRNQLLLLDIASGAVYALTPEIAEGPARHAAAQWSSDGRVLYLLSDRGRQFMSLAWLDVATAEMTYLRDEPWDAEGLALARTAGRLALVTNVDGYSRLEIFDVAAGWEARRPLPTPELPAGVLHSLTWSRDGARLAFALDNPVDAPDVWLWDVAAGSLRRATRSATGGIPPASFVAPSLVRYPTFDGREIPAFLFRPRAAASSAGPAVVYVHGGPESQFRPTFNPVIQYLVARGYSVLAPNVRGSSGYGYEYQSLDDVRRRMDSVADLKHAALWLGERGVADPTRIAVMGGSYGGFMVLAAVTTSPDLWAAGVDIVGIANFVTFLEHTGPWRRKLREAEYGSLEADRAFLEEISPLKHVDRIAAPLFVAHGANDPRVPVGEAEQIVAALRARGVPVEYLRFADEGHGLVKRANRLVAYPQIAAFLDRHVRDRPSAPTPL